MNIEQRIKLFKISQQMLEGELDTIEEKYMLDLGRKEERTEEKDEEYYPQFAQSIRNEAEDMGMHYELFYCLEKSIRKLIKDKMESEHGKNWWDQKVPPEIKKNAEENIKKEEEAAVTQRSNEEIDYVTFGELTQIVTSNWQTFSDTFNNQKAFQKVMTTLNTLRAPIAHCSPLAADEVMRLQLAVKDWFRLME